MRFFNLDVVSPGKQFIDHSVEIVEANSALIAAIAGGAVIVSAGIAVGIVFSVKAARSKKRNADIEKKLEEARAARDGQVPPDSKE